MRGTEEAEQYERPGFAVRICTEDCFGSVPAATAPPRTAKALEASGPRCGHCNRTAQRESLVIGQTSMRLRFGSALRLLGSDSRKPSRVFRYWRQTFLENESFGSDRRIPGNVTTTSHASTSLRWLCDLEDSESNDR